MDVPHCHDNTESYLAVSFPQHGALHSRGMHRGIRSNPAAEGIRAVSELKKREA